MRISPTKIQLARSIISAVAILGMGAVLLTAPTAWAQEQEARSAPASDGPLSSQPRVETAPNAHESRSPSVPGASVPSAFEPADPPSLPRRPKNRAPMQGKALNQGPGLPKNPSQVPVDGGLGWLAAAGAAYAVRRLHIQSNGGED